MNEYITTKNDTSKLIEVEKLEQIELNNHLPRSCDIKYRHELRINNSDKTFVYQQCEDKRPTPCGFWITLQIPLLSTHRGRSC